MKAVRTILVSIVFLSLVACEPGGVNSNISGDVNNDVSSDATVQLLPYITLDKFLTVTLRLDPNETEGAVEFFRDNDILLGSPDPDTGFVNSFPSSTYFLQITKVMAKACEEVVRDNPSILFPNGADDITTLYEVAIGREPSEGEIAEHASLQQQSGYSSTDMRMVGSCVAALSSTAMLTR